MAVNPKVLAFKPKAPKLSAPQASSSNVLLVVAVLTVLAVGGYVLYARRDRD